MVIIHILLTEKETFSLCVLLFNLMNKYKFTQHGR